MKQSNELVSIIIPHHNNVKILHNCITSLYQSTYQDFEIIVVDNASSDASISKIKKKYSNLHIVESSKNRGYAGGCNLGAQNASNELLLFLNNVSNIDGVIPGKMYEYFGAKRPIFSLSVAS